MQKYILTFPFAKRVYSIAIFFISYLFVNQSVAQDATNFIFYWGSLQARLETVNHYHATLQIKAGDMSRLLYRPPHLWNGKQLVPFQFQLEDMTFQNKADSTYKNQVTAFESAYSDKLEGNDTLHVRRIVLGEGLSGSIDIQIVSEEKQSIGGEVRPIETRVSGGIVEDLNSNNIRVEHGVVSYRWGKYISHGDNKSPYMSISQFWETMKEKPELLRMIDFQNTPTKAMLNIFLGKKENIIYGYKMQDTINYNHFLNKISFQKRIFKPNTLLYCTFMTDDNQEITIASQRIILVADDDPRLSLTEKEANTFTLKWGNNYQIKKKRAFLKVLKNTKGDVVHADATEYITHFSSIVDNTKTPIELFINNKKIEKWTCKMGFLNDKIIEKKGDKIAQKNFDATQEGVLFYDAQKGITSELGIALDSFIQKNGLIELFDIQVQGFDFQSFMFRLLNKSDLKNPIKENNIFIGTPIVQPNGKTVHIDYNLKIGSIGNIKIVDSEGKELWVKSGKFNMGEQSAVANELSLEKGKKYKVVIALGLGSSEKEFEF